MPPFAFIGDCVFSGSIIGMIPHLALDFLGSLGQLEARVATCICDWDGSVSQ